MQEMLQTSDCVSIMYTGLEICKITTIWRKAAVIAPSPKPKQAQGRPCELQAHLTAVYLIQAA